VRVGTRHNNLCIDKNNNEYWTKYTWHGTKLRLIEDRIELTDFNPENGTPTQIKTFSNGTLYGDMTATTMKDTATRTAYKPGLMVSWELFMKSQPE
jgi:hypothetical protein